MEVAYRDQGAVQEEAAYQVPMLNKCKNKE